MGKGKFPLANWTSMVKGHGLINDTDQPQTPPMQQEPGIAVVAPSDRIVHTNRVQTYDKEPAQLDLDIL